MERCVFCQGELDPTTHRCRDCGRPQLAGAARGSSGSLPWRCPHCGEPTQRADRFCQRCDYLLRTLCPACKHEAPLWAAFCPQCAQPLSRLASDERDGEVIAALPEQIGDSLARPFGLPNALAGPPTVPGVPAGPQSGAIGVPSTPGGAQGGQPVEWHAAPVRAGSKAAGQGLRAKLLGTTAGKVITAILVIIVVAIGGVAVVVAQPNVWTCCGRASARPTQASQPAGIITEFPLPTPTTSAAAIITGPDGNLWFTEFLNNGGHIGRITPQGQITEFATTSFPSGITAGPDGNIWFTEHDTQQIGRITAEGQITEFPLPTDGGGQPVGIFVGHDGNVWFTEYLDIGFRLGRISPSGQIIEFPLSLRTEALGGIIAGPDGNVWFIEDKGNQIWRITPTGQVTGFPLPTLTHTVEAITAGPDGNLWFTECSTGECQDSAIGRLTPGGKFSEFQLPHPAFVPDAIIAGSDNSLWFTECGIDPSTGDCNYSLIGRITLAGHITEFPLPIPTNGIAASITGPDSNIWFVDSAFNPATGASSDIEIGRITPAGQITEFPLPHPHDLLEEIVAGPDGNLWFIGQDASGNGNIGRITSGK